MTTSEANHRLDVHGISQVPSRQHCVSRCAVDDTGAEHEGVPGGGGGSPEGSWEFWFWPPVSPAAKRIRVIVSTLWEAAWAEVDIPGRPVR
jgi:hypothetical protein